MRSDHLKRHIGNHNDILSMLDDELRKELHTRQSLHISRLKRQQEIEEIAKEEGIPIILCRGESAALKNILDEDEKEEEDMLKDNQAYIEKIARGKRIFDILNKGIVREGSLSRERKEALHLYHKEHQLRDMSQAKLRPWQEHLFEITKAPSEREVIWVTGKDGNEG